MTCLFWTEGTPLWLHCCGWVAVDGGWGDRCPRHSRVMAFGDQPRWFGVNLASLDKKHFLEEAQREEARAFHDPVNQRPTSPVGGQEVLPVDSNPLAGQEILCATIDQPSSLLLFFVCLIVCVSMHTYMKRSENTQG